MTKREELLLGYMGKGWFNLLQPFLISDQMGELMTSVRQERVTNSVIPPSNDIDLLFRAFKEVQPDEVKIVILGQDPYHDLGRFDGLAFSNGNSFDTSISPSLKTILKEVEREYPNVYNEINHGRLFPHDLIRWAEQGVLLANTALTVVEGSPESHIQIWKPFTEYWIKQLSSYNKDVVWMLWGNKAQSYKSIITSNKIICTGHPSPLNTTNPFVGCNCFKEANTFLDLINKKEIFW